jgi:diketogulonate reductase-like aldo/keto reductase
LIEAQKYTKYKIVANQVHYNLIYREVEKELLLEYCQENDIMLVAYRPLEL